MATAPASITRPEPHEVFVDELRTLYDLVAEPLPRLARELLADVDGKTTVAIEHVTLAQEARRDVERATLVLGGVLRRRAAALETESSSR